jgi:hypothetical protein
LAKASETRTVFTLAFKMLSNYYKNFLNMFAQIRANQTAALLRPTNLTSNQSATEQIGDGVTTRQQTKLNTANPDSNDKMDAEKNNLPTENSVNENLDQENSENQNITNSENIGEPKKKKIRPNSPILFDSETLVAENESLEAYVVKSYLKRQIRFR